ncbi:MAG: hypothetical protein Q8L34_06200 [Candidatus Woesearchaeota archaeon]|nr:hypothetical protein [Candidatus Woesearchaeota archaeon]
MTITNLDESKIRATDLGLLFAVERLLGQYGVDAEIVGSVVEVDDRSKYRDIDLKVAYSNTNPRSEALCQLVRAANPTPDESPEVTRDTRRITKMLGTTVISSLENLRYINTFVERLFTIQKGKTTIDLCFEGLSLPDNLKQDAPLQRDVLNLYQSDQPSSFKVTIY